MSTNQILERLFGGSATVKDLRLFLFNQDISLTHEEITVRVHENSGWVKNALDHLVKTGFLKKTSNFREVTKLKNRKKTAKPQKPQKVRKPVWEINPSFPLTDSLRQFFHRANIVSPKDVVSKLLPVGNIKLIVIAGMFLEEEESRLDLLVVGDNLKKDLFEKAVSSIEALLGRELRYAAFETTEFLYRYSMFDKLLRDVFDFRHEKIFNKLAI